MKKLGLLFYERLCFNLFLTMGVIAVIELLISSLMVILAGYPELLLYLGVVIYSIGIGFLLLAVHFQNKRFNTR